MEEWKIRRQHCFKMLGILIRLVKEAAIKFQFKPSVTTQVITQDVQKFEPCQRTEEIAERDHDNSASH